MTFTHVMLPVLAALNVASEKLPCGDWAVEDSYYQSQFSSFYAQRDQALQKLTPNELRICASTNKTEINQFLKNNNFEIRTDHSGVLTVAALLDIEFNWDVPGISASFNYSYFEGDTVYKGRYKAFRREDGIILKNVNSRPLIKLTTKNGDSVSFSHNVFPLVNINEIFDVNELFCLHSNRYSIQHAKQQTKFHLDENKALLQSVVVITFADRQNPADMRFSGTPSTPFAIKIERPGLNLPLIDVAADVPTWQEITTKPK